MPQFSIVIAAYNREREILRAIQSCRDQDHPDFEIIVVDDGSHDNSYALASAIPDPRVRVLRHAWNRGGNAARNTGAHAATGEWVILLDSDDELLPGALRTIGAVAAGAGDDVHRIGFMYSRDDGRVSPLPPLREQIVDYPGYLGWLEGRRLYDFVPCTRRIPFQEVSFPEGLWSDQALYQMEFAKRHRTLFREETVAVVHADARNRQSHLRRDPTHARSSAARLGNEMEVLIALHGKAMRQFAPQTLQMFLRLLACYRFLAGDRTAAVKLLLGCIRETPLQPDVWLILMFGLAGSGALAKVRSWRGPRT